jgi:hypothetical protein
VCFEEAYLKDEGLFEQLLAIEDELIEEYLKGDLSSDRAQLFEHHYLASEHSRARVEAVRQLFEACSLHSMTQSAANYTVDDKFIPVVSRIWIITKQHLALSVGIVTALLLLIGAGVITEISDLRRQLASVSEERKILEQRTEDAERQLTHEREQLTGERQDNSALRENLGQINNRVRQLELELARLRSLKEQISILVLAPGIRDVGKLERAVISANTSFVELRVSLERLETVNLRYYRIDVKTVDGGREIWVEERISPRLYRSAQYISVRVPADRFTSAGGSDFVLSLGALTDVGEEYKEIENCYFKVVSK